MLYTFFIMHFSSSTNYNNSMSQVLLISPYYRLTTNSSWPVLLKPVYTAKGNPGIAEAGSDTVITRNSFKLCRMP